jgi:hypothetical protein
MSMQTAQGTVLQSLRAVQGFLDAHADRLADVNKTGARQKLDETVVELSTHVATQTGSLMTSRGSTQKQYALRKELLQDHMSAIARVAKADLPPTPEVDMFRMPPGRPTVERLAAHAYGMAQAAAPFAAVFTSAGLAPTFITDLTAAADAMILSIKERTQVQSARGGATQALKKRLSTGRRIVHVLDAFVRTEIGSDPNLLGAWKQVKRVRKTASRPDTTPPVNPKPASEGTQPTPPETPKPASEATPPTPPETPTDPNL